MTHFLFILTSFILFVIEGTVVQVFSPDRWGIPILMIPRFVVVLLIFSALFLGRLQGLFMGLLFGLLYDVVYGGVIGIYGFSMALVGYFSGLTFKVFQQSLLLILLTIAACLVLHEFIVYGLLMLIGYVQMETQVFFFQKVIPTLILNMIFATLVSYPLRTILVQMKQEEEKL
ncbi:rod shape-determining protein MreD [Bacillus horti]|uniref:Rod shape-determining protein MreD n=1 Tax=Caldalkalibacillus horti TaxID=77523 RepID=A0ABT9VTG9_9BACI|nr:rod shape-determining protein MreD [Bacillus horti]MDQ0164288.1 rod shape-determining protein MreD [Bacillus horti]